MSANFKLHFYTASCREAQVGVNLCAPPTGILYTGNIGATVQTLPEPTCCLSHR